LPNTVDFNLLDLNVLLHVLLLRLRFCS